MRFCFEGELCKYNRNLSQKITDYYNSILSFLDRTKIEDLDENNNLRKCIMEK